MARRKAAAPRRRRVRRLVTGNRAYLLSLVVLLAMLSAMAAGPLQSFMAAGDRVDELTASRNQLAAEVEALEGRRDQLHDPEELELIARSRLGMVKPGEVPYVVVVEEPELDELGPAPGQQEAQPFLERLVDALRGLVD